jgi:hypothetical protein
VIVASFTPRREDSMMKMILTALAAIGAALPAKARTLTRMIPVQAAHYDSRRTSGGSVLNAGL